MVLSLATAQAARASYFRFQREDYARTPIAKEWLHFCVMAPDLEVLINMSLMGTSSGSAVARLVLLVRKEDRWLGGVEDVPIDTVRVCAGKVDATFGDTTLACRTSAFELQLRPKQFPISARLRLEPLTVPLARPHTELGAGVVNWLVIPKLKTSGTVSVDGKTHVIGDAPAYHDHNWGAWQWGRDFFWQWAFGLPTDESKRWTVVFYRLLNRQRTVEHAHALLLWDGPELVRSFREGEVTTLPEGLLRPKTVYKIPPVMALVAPETTTDVCQTLRVAARTRHDAIELDITNSQVAQLLVPNEADLDTVVINEVVGGFHLSGNVGEQSIRAAGTCFHEYVTWS